MTDLKPLIAKAANGQALTREEARDAFDVLMSGEATPSQIGGFLMALRVRGETVDEITGAVEIMREKMTTVKAPSDAIDIVGTGGDASGSYNISTCAAFVTAGCGIKIAKHGNRALSSKSGSADVFAPAHHVSMKHVGPTRVELGTRTIFNLLGPLSNPAGVKRQVTGVFAKAWVEPLAHVLNNLGSERAWICHGEGGFDEIVPSGTTWIAELKDGKVTSIEIKPEDVGIARSSAADLKGGDAAQNAEALRGVLEGKKNAFRDAAVMTSAAALLVAGKAKDLRDGVAQAQKAIDGGGARTVLDKLVKVSNG
jgi:anthranilate phosphoribosyltransferase